MQRIIYYILAVVLALNFTMVNVFADENSALTKINAVHILSRILPAWKDAPAFDDTDDKTAAYYRSMKILDAEYGNSFVPDKTLTTQEFLVMLKRALDISAPDLFYNNQKIKWHYDQNEIAPEYQSQIAFLSALDIWNNSGHLRPRAVISEGMASYYVSLAVHAQDFGKRSNCGRMNQKRLPVLMYHVIDQPSGPYPYVYVSPESFEQQIKYLYDNGYTFLFPEELSLADELGKCVVLTFDDGYVQTYTNAYAILKKYNAKATLFMVSDKIGENEYCSEAQLREMSDSGVFRVYSHSKNHSDLRQLNESELDEQFSSSNDKIYNITKREVTSIAYPYGFFDDRVLSRARRYYKSGFSVTDRGRGSVYEIQRSSIDDTINIKGYPIYLK